MITVMRVLAAMTICLFQPSATWSEAPNLDMPSKQSEYGEIDAVGLKILLDTKTPLDLLDARKDKYFKGTLIPGAKRLPSDSTEEQMASLLPDKQKLIVVYCAGKGCSASKTLSEALVKADYKNVMEFPGGEKDWKAKGFELVSSEKKDDK